LYTLNWVSTIRGEVQWVDLATGQKQFRHNGGGILNWHPVTGRVDYQGKEAGKSQLQTLVELLLSGTTPEKRSQPEPADRSSRELSPRQPAPATDAPFAGASARAGDSLDALSAQGQYLTQTSADSEIVIGLVGAVGTDLGTVAKIIEERLEKHFNYRHVQIRISTDVIPLVVPPSDSGSSEFAQMKAKMDDGDKARELANDNAVLALGAAAIIAEKRKQECGSPQRLPRHAYTIRSLKRPEEVNQLRAIYPGGFYLIGVHCDPERRQNYLKKSRNLSDDEADLLMRRDERDDNPYGQRTGKPLSCPISSSALTGTMTG
jgi:hypothetical protein